MCRLLNQYYFLTCKRALSCSFHTLKKYTQHNTDICTPDRRDILHLIILILVPNLMNVFQSILVLKRSTGVVFFNFIVFYMRLSFLLFSFPPNPSHMARMRNPCDGVSHTVTSVPLAVVTDTA